MRVEILTQRDFIKVKPDTLIKGIRSKLLNKLACVVFDKEKYLGVISFKDLALHTFERVVDCMTEKPAVTCESDIAKALHTMLEYNFEVLPVFKNESFLGLIFKNDIVEYLHELNRELETKVREKTAELEEATKLAEEKENLQSAFLANLSHEIRTPLNGILGFLEFLIQPDVSVENMKEYADIINKSCKRLFAIIDDVLLMSKLETGQLRFQSKNINLPDFLDELHAFYSPLAKKNGLKLGVSTEENGVEPCVQIDDMRIRQIFDNLLNNALKFTQTGGIEFGYGIDDKTIRFFVKDTGQGIKPEFHTKIFERFQQVDVNYLNNFKGIGLGLAIVKSLVETMGGTMGVVSEFGKGSEFYFTLPFTPATSQPCEPDATEDKIEKKNFSVLLVDDEPINLELLEIHLKRLTDYEILTASNGREAVELCQQNKAIHLVFMDIKMPIMNGIEATRIIKIERPEIIIVAQSAYTSEKDKNKAIKAGCSGFICKPISLDVLSKTIAEYTN